MTNSFGPRFREVRRALHLTQEEMAKELLLSRQYLALIETSKAEPSMRVVRELEATRLRLTPQSTKTHEPAEDQAPYGRRADRGATLRHPSADDGLASPTHTEPTRDSVERLAAKVVAIAARTPGGIGLVHIKLTRCLADLQEIAP